MTVEFRQFRIVYALLTANFFFPALGFLSVFASMFDGATVWAMVFFARRAYRTLPA